MQPSTPPSRPLVIRPPRLNHNRTLGWTPTRPPPASTPPPRRSPSTTTVSRGAQVSAHGTAAPSQQLMFSHAHRSFLPAGPADVVTLLCLNQAKEGGGECSTLAGSEAAPCKASTIAVRAWPRGSTCTSPCRTGLPSLTRVRHNCFSFVFSLAQPPPGPPPLPCTTKSCGAAQTCWRCANRVGGGWEQVRWSTSCGVNRAPPGRCAPTATHPPTLSRRCWRAPGTLTAREKCHLASSPSLRSPCSSEGG